MHLDGVTIVVPHSGETIDTLAALRYGKARDVLFLGRGTAYCRSRCPWRQGAGVVR